MKFDEKIKHEKLQCDINRVAVQIKTSSSSKIDKHEYLTGVPLQQHKW